MSILEKSASELHHLLQNRSLTSVSILDAYYAQIERVEPTVKACLALR